MPAGEERRIFHAVRSLWIGRIDDRDVAVRIGAEPLPVVLERAFASPRSAVRPGRRAPAEAAVASSTGAAEAAVAAGVPRLESLDPLDEVGARGPREVVDVFLVIAMGRRAVAVVDCAIARTPVAPTSQPAARSGGRRRRRSRKRTRSWRGTDGSSSPRPAGRRAWGTTARGSRSCRSRRSGRTAAVRVRSTSSSIDHALAGRDRRRQRDGHHRPIVAVAVVGSDEPHRGDQVDLVARRSALCAGLRRDARRWRVGTIGQRGDFQSREVIVCVRSRRRASARSRRKVDFVSRQAFQ